jgi:hypothetical protein
MEERPLLTISPEKYAECVSRIIAEAFLGVNAYGNRIWSKEPSKAAIEQFNQVLEIQNIVIYEDSKED